MKAKEHEITAEQQNVRGLPNIGGFPHMNQNAKYIVSILGLLFLFTAGYSGLLIYRSKHDPSGSTYNLISTLTGKTGDKETLHPGKKSPDFARNTAQSDQSLTKSVPVTAAMLTENGQRQLVLDFYSGYFKTINAGQNPAAALQKYGTANLADQYGGAQPGRDPLSCRSDTSIKLLSATILSSEPDEGSTRFYVQFNDKNGIASTGQVSVTGSGSTSLIDGVSCRGEI